MPQLTWSEVDEITARPELRYRGAFSFVCSGVQFTRLIKNTQKLDVAAACVSPCAVTDMWPSVNVVFYYD